MTREEYWYWLCTAPDIFREDISRILSVYQDPEVVFETGKEELYERNLVTKLQAEGLKQTAESGSFSEKLKNLKGDGIRFLYPECPDYPQKLKLIPDYPYSLYVKGNMPDPEKPSVGMVGARASSTYGMAMANKFSKALAGSGVQIISGMAIGIDSESARGALAGGGKTFAVLGSGVDVIYPVHNFGLYYEIIASGGGILSEYVPGTPAVAWQFPARNRIISGLSDKLLVMEAKERSGTLITVRYALDQGRDVYALPGRLTDKNSEGCNRMIADGAGILLSPNQLLSEIFHKDFSKTKEPVRKPDLNGPLRKIYELLDAEPVPSEILVEKSGLSPEEVSAFLTELELSGLARSVSQNCYVKEF